MVDASRKSLVLQFWSCQRGGLGVKMMKFSFNYVLWLMLSVAKVFYLFIGILCHYSFS